MLGIGVLGEPTRMRIVSVDVDRIIESMSINAPVGYAIG